MKQKLKIMTMIIQNLIKANIVEDLLFWAAFFMFFFATGGFNGWVEKALKGALF